LVDRNIRRQSGSTHSLTWFERAVGKVYGLLGAPERLCMATRVAGHALHPALADLPVGAWITGVVSILSLTSPRATQLKLVTSRSRSDWWALSVPF
jgi:hypothetical protein